MKKVFKKEQNMTKKDWVLEGYFNIFSQFSFVFRKENYLETLVCTDSGNPSLQIESHLSGQKCDRMDVTPPWSHQGGCKGISIGKRL
jgi:hypothetical protein